ncbi:DUF1801 domain-containing protein [Caulobacter sp. CCG-8]|uniref:iron chaperone n=1 Tax=Caulobacter sp. CCG-8 TaxID=3127958 RepID=UPI00307D736D
MVQSKAASVDAFMAEVGDERRPALERLRALCREELAGWPEGMSYGMPGYGPPGAPVVAFNDQKQYIAFYAGQTAVARFADRLAGVDCGKSCIRYRKPDAIDFDLVRDILRDVRARREAGA